MTLINREYHKELKSWPFIEAFKLINKFGGVDNFSKKKKDYVLQISLQFGN